MFNNYFEKAVVNLGIKEYENKVADNTNSLSKDGVDMYIERFKDHQSVKIINENVSFESHFSFKYISETDV